MNERPSDFETDPFDPRDEADPVDDHECANCGELQDECICDDDDESETCEACLEPLEDCECDEDDYDEPF
jgi:hypothetical protein